MCERHAGIHILLDKCSIKYNNPHIRNMKFNIQDRGICGSEQEYTMCYNKNNKNTRLLCGPDWTFIHWPSASINSFEETKNMIIEESHKEYTVDKIGWYGNLFSPLNDVIEYITRPLLAQIGEQNPHLFDIVCIIPLHSKINNIIPNYMSLPDLVKYRYLIDIGGNGYSGRLKYLLFSKRPLLLVDRNYIEYFHDYLIPYFHYVPVKMDLSDVLIQAEWMRNNDDKCTKIAENAYNFAMENFTEDKILEQVHNVFIHKTS